jgi:hypothetical protein
MGLFVLGKITQVLVLDGLGLRLERLLFGCRQVLPVFTDQLGDLGEAQVTALELLAHFFTAC